MFTRRPRSILSATPQGSARIRGAIDDPPSDTYSDGAVALAPKTCSITGWAIGSRSPIQRIEIWIDGQKRGDATHGLTRADRAGNVGFAWAWDLSAADTRIHTVAVRAITRAGES